MTDKPHNNLFEFLFSQKIIVKELIQNLLTDLKKKVDLRTLLIDNTSYIDDPLARNLISHIAVYLVKTTTLKSQEIINLVDKLPTTTKKVIMTGYENLLMEGEKRGVKIGLQKGAKQAEQYKVIEISIKLLNSKMTDDFIMKISEIPITTLSLLRLNYNAQFKNEALQILFAEHLMQQYNYLTDKDIITFTQLKPSKFEKIKK